MPTLRVHPARRLRGTLRVPGDKSISHRYLLLAAIADGPTELRHLAPGEDVAATIACLAGLGVSIDAIGDGAVAVVGRGWAGLSAPPRVLDAANSGTTMRLLAGLVAGRPFTTSITGDASLRRRPMARVIDPLTAMGAAIESDHQRAPLTVRGGGLRGIEWRPPVASAQVKSAIMLAGLSAHGETTVHEPLPTRDHTERAFPIFGLTAHVDGTTVTVPGEQDAVAPSPPSLEVPGDPSSASVWAAAAAALPGSMVQIDGVCLNPRRLGALRALARMGGEVSITEDALLGGEPVGTIRVAHGEHRGLTLTPQEVPDLIDELPILAARAALGGRLAVTGAGELRVKESDRISALVSGLRALGVRAVERPDGFVVEGDARPTGGHADAAGDHRLVMAFAIVGLGASAPVSIGGAEAVAVSYPAFAADLASLTQ